MSLILPPANNYQSPLIALPSRILREPPDGPRQVSLEFDWTTMGKTTGLQTAISVNLANNATLRFSQIVSLKVDNSQCGCDVQFVFTDTQETVLIPAHEPNAIFPVFTDQVQFFAIALGTVLSNDVTRVQVLNFVPPPATVDPTTPQLTSAALGKPLGGAATNIIPAGVNGTLVSIDVSFTIQTPPTDNSQGFVFVEDGNGNFLVNGWAFGVVANTGTVNATLFSFDNVNWRFQNGLQVFAPIPSGWTDGGGVYNAFASYRTP